MEMVAATERIVGLQLFGRNNYTLRNEQHIEGEKWPRPSQVAVAIALDTRDDDATERQGYSGQGAGSTLIATLDDGTEEEIEDMRHPLVAALPIETPIRGTKKHLRQFIARQQEQTVWNGHNHVRASSSHSTALLRTIREAEAQGR